MTMRTIIPAVTVVCALLSASVQAAEIRVFSSNAIKSVLEALAPEFEKASGHKIAFTYETAAVLKTEIEKGAAFDVAILTAAGIDDLIKQGKIAAASRAWAKAQEMMADPAFALIILDEMNIALRYDYLDLQAVVAALTNRRDGLHIVVTGRNAKPELIAAADLWSIDRLYWSAWGGSAKEVFATDATIDYLKKQPGPFRVMSVEDPSKPAGASDPYLGNIDGLMAHGIRQTLGYHGNQIGRYDVYQPVQMWFNPSTWAMTNTRYLLINNDSFDIPGARRVVGPVKNAAGSPVSLYELPGANPFAWVAPAVTVISLAGS